MNKEWIKISDSEYTLQFKPNGEVEFELRIERDFEGDWILSCFELDACGELIADSKISSETAMLVAEEMVRDHYRELGEHYLELLRLFDEEEDKDVTIDDAIFCAKVEAETECCENCRFYGIGSVWCRDVARVMVETLEKTKESTNE